jgi:hypothetical protein
MVRLHPDTKPATPNSRLAYRHARWCVFFRQVRINNGDDAFFAFALHLSGLAPGTGALIRIASFLEDAPYRSGADGGQCRLRLAQRALKQAQRPGCRAILRPIRRTLESG